MRPHVLSHSIPMYSHRVSPYSLSRVSPCTLTECPHVLSQSVPMYSHRVSPCTYSQTRLEFYQITVENTRVVLIPITWFDIAGNRTESLLWHAADSQEIFQVLFEICWCVYRVCLSLDSYSTSTPILWALIYRDPMSLWQRAIELGTMPVQYWRIIHS